MALIKCKDCAKDFSTEAKACPNCGARPPRSKFSIFLLLAFLASLGIMPLLNSMDDGSLGPSAWQIQDQERLRILGVAVEGADGIRRAMRNPDSFVAAGIVHNPQSGMICYEYRAQNGFGGMNTEYAILKSDREFIYQASSGFSKVWNKECDPSVSQPISADVVNATLKDF